MSSEERGYQTKILPPALKEPLPLKFVEGELKLLKI